MIDRQTVAQPAAWAGPAAVVARHDLWLLGVRFLSMDHAIDPRP